MRRILIDHERQRRAQKRGGAAKRAQVDLDRIPAETPAFDDLLALDDSLDKLAEFDPRQAEVIEMRFFGQYTIPEIADLMGLSVSTIKNEIATARMWLLREMRRGDSQ
jgi:RNA polymerase sigma factor (TIGR02999 family)